jgi:Site-specific recombinase XerD
MTLPPEEEASVPRRLPRYCVEDTDRHGNIRIYVRIKGRSKVRLHGTPWTPEFMKEYEAAVAGTDDQPRKRSTPGSWRWLCEQYLARCADYLQMDPETRSAYRRTLEGTYDEPLNPNSKLLFKDLPIARMTAKHVRVLRDRKAATPDMANARVKVIRAVFRFATDEAEDLAKENPAASVKYFKRATTGHHTWTVDEVRQYETKFPIGTKQRLALALMLYTGVRRSDVVRLGRQHAANGWLRFRAHKNRNRSPSDIELPILTPLQQVLDATRTGNLTFLVTKYGKPYTAKGFGGQFKDWCVDAGLPHCSAHGLRKAAATIAAENGATEFQLMSIFGWKDAKQAARYTRAARRKKLAGDAMGLIDLGENEYTVGPT